jgi:hypothetical protein
VLIGVFVIAGAPLLFIVYGALNELLAGHVNPGRLLLAGPALLVLAVVLLALARVLRSLE